VKTHPECIPCFYRQAEEACRRVTRDPDAVRAVLERVEEAVRIHAMDSGPPAMGEAIYRAIREVTGNEDPFGPAKAEFNEKALRLYPAFRRRVESAPDPRIEAVKLAVAGNVIDFGPNPEFDLEREIEAVEAADFAVFDIAPFLRLADKARSVFVAGDNAGEIVFDRLLLETLGLPAVYAVRGGPAINDALRADAAAVGMDRIARIVDTGVAAPGVFLDRAPAEFLDAYRSADLLISKGQGNFESLESETRPVAFLLKAKCKVVARHLGVRLGDLVVKVPNPGG
jgi:hypothetical protein